MDFTLSENQLFLKDGAERFIADRYDFESRRKRLAGQSGTDRDMWQQFADMGWLALLVPEKHGGLGWALQDATIILQEFGKALVAEPFLEGAVVAARMLALSTASVAGSLLAGIAAGTTLVIPALLEAGNRYDFAVPKTEATRDGDRYRVRGRKIMVPAGDAADQFIVTASIDGAVALFLVPAEAQGVARRQYRMLDGSWAADVDFDDVMVGGDDLIGAGDVLEQVIDEAALGVTAQQIGSMDRVLETTADYLQTRRQFGQPLAGFQALQHIMSDLFVNSEMARSALYGGLSETGGTSDRRRAAASAARVRGDRAALTVGNMGIYLHGGMGMTVEYPVGHHYRRLVQLTRAYGDTEFHLARFEDVMLAAA